MDLRERYHGLCDAGLYTFELHERQFALPMVDDLLVPFARERLAALRELVDGADHVDLADDAYAVAEFIHHYLRLRRELHGDLRAQRPAAGWRVIPRFAGGFGVRALPGDPPTVLVLRPAPGRGDGRGWDLTRLTGPAGPATTWTVTLPAEEGTNIGVIHAPAEVESDETLVAHLRSGLAALTNIAVKRRG